MGLQLIPIVRIVTFSQSIMISWVEVRIGRVRNREVGILSEI